MSTMHWLALNFIKRISEHNLIDIFRELNPDLKKFSWKKWGTTKFARLDYFLISDSLLPYYVEKTEILQSCFSDHSPILLDIDFAKFQRGRGFWKFNNSLLKDQNFVEIVKIICKEVTCQYAIIENDTDLVENLPPDIFNHFVNQQTPESLQNLQLKINPELFLDTLLMQIRGATIKYISELKRKN